MVFSNNSGPCTACFWNLWLLNRAGLSGRLLGEVDSSRGGFRTSRILQRVDVEIVVAYVCCILRLRIDWLDSVHDVKQSSKRRKGKGDRREVVGIPGLGVSVHLPPLLLSEVAGNRIDCVPPFLVSWRSSCTCTFHFNFHSLYTMYRVLFTELVSLALLSRLVV